MLPLGQGYPLSDVFMAVPWYRSVTALPLAFMALPWHCSDVSRHFYDTMTPPWQCYESLMAAVMDRP